MPVEKKEILPDIAKRMSLDRFFATQRDVVNDELESLVPDLIEDALENPTGSYQRATKSQMYQLTTINKTTKDIKKDTTEIIRFLNDDLMSKLDEIQEAAEAAGDGLMDNMFDMMDMFDLDGPDRRKNRKNRRSRRPRGPKGGRGLRGLAGRAMTSVGDFFRGPSKTPLPTQMQPPKATAVLEDTKLKNYKYDPSIDRNRYTSGPDKGKLAPFDEADKLARKTPTAIPKTSGVPKISVPPVAEVPKSFLSRMMSGAGNAVSSVTSGTVSMVKGVGRFAMKAGGKIAMPVLAGMAIWSAWKQIGELPKPPVVTQEQYTTMISDIIGKTVAEFGLMAVGAVVGFLVGLPFAGVGAVPGAIAGILGGLGADYVWGDDIQAMANNPVYKELINKIVNYFMSEDSADADKKRKEQAKEAKQTVNSINVTDPRKDLKPEQLAAKGLVPSLTSVGAGIGATSAIAMSLTPQNPLGSQMPVMPSMMPSSTGIDTTGLINPLSFFEEQTTPDSSTQTDNKIRIPIESDTYKDMSNDELKALGLKRVGSETVDGQKVNVYQKIKAIPQTGTAAPVMMPVASAGAPAGSPEARLVPIGQEQGLARKDAGVTTSLLAHLQGASGASGATASGGSGSGAYLANRQRQKDSGGGTAGTAKAPKALTTEQQGFFSDLGKGAIDASSPRAAFLEGQSSDQLAKMGVEKVTQKDGTVMYQQKAVTDEEAIASLKSQAALGQNVQPGTFADTLMSGENLPSVRQQGKEFQSYNKGAAHGYKAGTMDFENMPLEEVMRLQNLPKNHPDKLFAAGAYQVIPETMKEAVNALGLDPKTTKYDKATQTKIMAYLTTQKAGRQGIGQFIKGESEDLEKAQEQMSQEWASMASVSKGGASYYGGPNKAHVSLAQTKAALEDARKRYKENIAAGMSEQQAYEQALVGTVGNSDVAGFNPTTDQVTAEKEKIKSKRMQVAAETVGTPGGQSGQTATQTASGYGQGAPVEAGQFKTFEGAATGHEAAKVDGVSKKAGTGGKYITGGSLATQEDVTGVKTASGANFNVNKKVAGNYKAFFRELESMGYYIDPKDKGAGGYNVRKKKGASGWSEHSYGTAVDINPSINTDSSGGKNNLPPDVGKIAAKYGLTWGGYWDRQDTMHFEYNPSHNVPASEDTSAFDSQFAESVKNDPNKYYNLKTVDKTFADTMVASSEKAKTEMPTTLADASKVDKPGTPAATAEPVKPTVPTPTTTKDTLSTGGTATVQDTQKLDKMFTGQGPTVDTVSKPAVDVNRTVPAPIPEPSVSQQIGDLKKQMAENNRPPAALVAPNQSPAMAIPTQTKPDLTSAAGRQVAYAAGVPMPPIGSGNAPFNAASFTMPGEFGMIS